MQREIEEEPIVERIEITPIRAVIDFGSNDPDWGYEEWRGGRLKAEPQMNALNGGFPSIVAWNLPVWFPRPTRLGLINDLAGIDPSSVVRRSLTDSRKPPLLVRSIGRG